MGDADIVFTDSREVIHVWIKGFGYEKPFYKILLNDICIVITRTRDVRYILKIYSGDDVLLKAHKDNYALVLQADFLHNYKVEWMIKHKRY